tara:strand:+ start:487 stop:687 length:201 start_codon:yes stop_codon:yes gene_type:complete
VAAKKSDKKWIKKAIKKPGAFKAKAKKAGMSTKEYAARVLKKGSKASPKTKRQASLAKTLSKMRRG